MVENIVDKVIDARDFGVIDIVLAVVAVLEVVAVVAVVAGVAVVVFY